MLLEEALAILNRGALRSALHFTLPEGIKWFVWNRCIFVVDDALCLGNEAISMRKGSRARDPVSHFADSAKSLMVDNRSFASDFEAI